MKFSRPPSGVASLLFLLFLLFSPLVQSAEVNITPQLESISVMHGNEEVVIMRNQNQKNTVNPAYALTSRQCPPYCIQPGVIAPGVETVTELEVIDYLQKISNGDNSILLVDSRTPEWASKGTIPGSINIPWSKLNPEKDEDLVISIGAILEQHFNAVNLAGLWDFSGAKTLVMFCNGMWCDQSPKNIRSLLRFGYPAHKIKWYRGGMQNWENLGLTTVKALP